MIQATQSYAAVNWPWLFTCDVRWCYWRTVHKTYEEAEAVRDQHNLETCPMANDSTIMDETDDRGLHYTKPHLGKSMVEKMWDELDSIYENLAQATTSHGEDRLKGRARGVAWCIALCSGPYYEKADEVVREAVKRYQMKKGERPWEPTPGYKWNPPPIESAAYRKAREESRGAPDPTATRAAAKKKAEPKLTAEQIEGIKDAITSGMFDEKACADIFKVSVEQVRQAISG